MMHLLYSFIREEEKKQREEREGWGEQRKEGNGERESDGRDGEETSNEFRRV